MMFLLDPVLHCDFYDYDIVLHDNRVTILGEEYHRGGVLFKYSIIGSK